MHARSGAARISNFGAQILYIKVFPIRVMFFFREKSYFSDVSFTFLKVKISLLNVDNYLP